MDKLREVLSGWARLKALRDEIAEEIEYRRMLHLLRQKMRSGDVGGVAEIYACIRPNMERHDDELAMQCVLDGLGRFFRQHSLSQASFVLSVVGGLNSEIFHRAKSLFADYVVRTSSEYADQQVTGYISNMLILAERLDPSDVFGLRAFVDKLCMERLCVFAREGEAVAEDVARNASQSSILNLDRWICQCAKLLCLRYGIDTSSIGVLYERAETLYFDACVKSIILKDQKHGADDLVFLAKKICARIARIPECSLKNRIKTMAAEGNLLSSRDPESC
ncbi:UNVERIFIED_CONTAM: hypothetical protein PYX00_011562 [Menopon gallinae]|uniref:Uncharacterized protein n=1 Tax=Menopon gallinae TaxID=328185 RepID=A0AAW2H7U0_9NEOP